LIPWPNMLLRWHPANSMRKWIRIDVVGSLRNLNRAFPNKMTMGNDCEGSGDFNEGFRVVPPQSDSNESSRLEVARDLCKRYHRRWTIRTSHSRRAMIAK
jgi:hypothetical protein